MVLDTLKPGMNFEDLYSAIFSLDDSATELSPIILPYVRNYEENVTKKATEMISSYIKVGKFDAAAKLGKDAASHQVKLQWQGSASPSSSPKEPTQLSGQPPVSPGT